MEGWQSRVRMGGIILRRVSRRLRGVGGFAVFVGWRRRLILIIIVSLMLLGIRLPVTI